ncbi:hypothetical protein [Streptomyces sp. NPDC091215]|uniref:hypothetical protein n=1 Tax=Streptomyces sp. NPDC091215 TaxID=3155192 RepID=UPI003441544B
MSVDDCMEPLQWAASPQQFDRLALEVLRAARSAAQELRRNPPNPEQRAWALGVLAGQRQALLGPAPMGAATPDEFVRSSLQLAVHLRAHSWTPDDLARAGLTGKPEADGLPPAGERRTADAFDVLGRLMLPHASPEGWTATLITDLAKGDKTLEAAVKLGKYILHPTFLSLADDMTRMLGEAVHNRAISRLRKLVEAERKWAGVGTSHLTQNPTPDDGVSITDETPPASDRDRTRIVGLHTDRPVPRPPHGQGPQGPHRF